MLPPPENLLFSKVFSLVTPGQVDSLDWDALGAIMVPLFDGAVDSLRDPRVYPNRRINKLANLFWNLVGSKITPMGVTPGVPSMALWMEIRQGSRFACVVAPVTWPRLVVEDPWMAFGGVVFVASQACDYHHNQVPSSEVILERADAYEAEFYRTALGLNSQQTGLGVQYPLGDKTVPFTPNEHQQKVLAKYPGGLDSLDPALVYPITPFTPGDFDEIEKIAAEDN